MPTELDAAMEQPLEDLEELQPSSEREEKAEENGWDENEREAAAPHPGHRRLRPDCRLRGAPHLILYWDPCEANAVASISKQL